MGAGEWALGKGPAPAPAPLPHLALPISHPQPVPLQSNPFLRRPQEAAADTTQASAADTLSLADRLRSDSAFSRAADLPSTVGAFFEQLLRTLLDPGVWLGLLGLLLKIVVILVLATALLRVIDRITARWVRHVENLPPAHPRRQRAATISNLVSSTGRYVIWPVALIMILSEIHIDVGALVATAGIAGLAIGFGAQTLVQDVISGVFLLFDDTIHVGDLVRIGSDTGTVEEIGVRLIKVRKFDGELMMVPAGELRTFGNLSIGYVRVVVSVNLTYGQDLDEVLPVLQREADAWAAEQDPSILVDEAPTVQAITAFNESSVTARVVMAVRPGEQFAADRALRVRLKKALCEEGIEIPFARRTVYLRGDAEPAAPADTSNGSADEKAP